MMKNVTARFETIFRTVCLMAVLAVAVDAHADDAKITTEDSEGSSFVINKDKGSIEFNLYLHEKNGTHSYWVGNPEIWLDGVKICTLTDLGLPIVSNGKDAKTVANELEDLRDYDELYKTYEYNKFISVASWDPRYYSSSKEYWVTIGMTLGYNIEGGNHRVEVRGTWADNEDGQYSGRKTLGFNTKKYSIGNLPASAGAATRKNKTIMWNVDGLKQDRDWRYAVSLQKSDKHSKSFADDDVSLFKYFDTEINALQDSCEFVVNNFLPYTIYPRVITWNNSKNAEWGNGSIKSTFSFRKDYSKVVVKGFPRAGNVSATTVDAYSKSVKVTWTADIYDKANVDTKGRWYVFRKKKDDKGYERIADVAYSTLSYKDNDSGKEYFDTSNGETTQYIYAVCFVPNGWTVNSPDDADGLYTSTDYKLTRTFTISDLKATESSSGVTIDWQISPITDASNSNVYTLRVQRSADNVTWEDLKEERITSSSKTSGSYFDNDGLRVYENHFYRVTINAQGRDYESNHVSAGLTGGTSVKQFTATRGVYSKSVKMQWSVDQVGTDPTYFLLQRRPLGSTDADDWTDVYTTFGTGSLYSYDDATVNPGSYYEYHLKLWIYRDSVEKGIRDYFTDGFGLATGVLSGRVYYDSGTSVEGVKVSLRPSEANGESVSQFRSLRIDDVDGAGIQYKASAGVLRKLMGKDYTVQMYLSPDSSAMTDSELYTLFDASGKLTLSLKRDDGGSDSCAIYVGTQPAGLRIPSNQWSHLSAVAKGNSVTLYIVTPDSVVSSAGSIAVTAVDDGDSTLVLGNSSRLDADTHFVGYVDEFRLFSKSLTEKEISLNYNHTLSGSEDGLAIYWTMDEKLNAQTLVYDYSKTGDASNVRIGRLTVPAPSSDYVPTDEQLSLSALTDADGNFMVRGIPFSGEGTNYIATPSLGIHQFSPSSISCYVSLNSLVFSGQNFTDVSSFPVSGRVRYAQTTIPVEGAGIYIDGLPASKDGEMITTDQDGNYTVDVPIGDHFISVKMNGHTFTNEGRYPADPSDIGLRQTFEREFSNVDFFDETTVVVAGRVAGGKIENSKPLGVGEGTANIGKAVLTLNFNDDPSRAEYIHAKRVETETAFYYEQDSTRRNFATAQGLSKAYVPEGKNYIRIETDSLTGEFAVSLPPLRYTTSSVVVPSQDNITFDNQTIDATNVLMEYVDSTTSSGEVKRFAYNASAKFTYRSPSMLEITENAPGCFGTDSISVTDINGVTEKVAVYNIDESGAVDYAFGYPIYEQLVEYQYNVSAYERYVNKDGAKEEETREPLAYTEVTIKNEYASSTTVMLADGEIHEVEDDTFTLDSLGTATYSFVAGLPNIQSPYTRQLKASYEIDDQPIEWDGQIEAVVVGALTTGNDFTTAGPDKVMMILRDPPGTRSKTVYAKGTEITTKETYSQRFSRKDDVKSAIQCGTQTIQVSGFGTFVGFTIETKNTVITGLDFVEAYTHSDTKSTTVTTTEQISTGTSADYVGACGDVFIGSATNIVFGTCRYVHVAKNEATGEYELIMEDGISTGEKFTTEFNYTAWHVENKVIPDFIKLRNNLLQHVANPDSVAQPPVGSDPIYVTTLSEDDPNYGLNNDDPAWGDEAIGDADVIGGRIAGPSYTIILPQDHESNTYQDMVEYYNMQVSLWQQQLANNEKAKVDAIENRTEYLDKNYSFDAGATVTVTHNTRNYHDWSHSLTTDQSIITGSETEFELSGNGTKVSYNATVSLDETEVWGGSEAETESMSYTLQEEGLGENLSVDVFDSPDGFGPIFYTRAGATSNPFEDEVVTKYYQPGTVIQEKTLQVEKPELVVVDPIVTGVPAGSAATFRVKLRNNSETEKAVTYGLTVLAAKNPDGAQVYMDGRNINNGITILVPFGELTKTLTLRQSNRDVMDYDDITLRFYSTSQPNDYGTSPGIYSDASVSVQFQPSCSDIALSASTSVVNSESTAPLQLYITGYDYSLESLRGVRLEYKGIDDADFLTLQEYRKDTAEVAADHNLLVLPALTGGTKLTYSLDMGGRSFSDQTYVFRAVTICNQNGNIVNNESDEVEVVRDMSRPQLISTPSPSSGVLNPGDDISITFNEDIASGSITADGNFSVTGRLNDSEVVHATALRLDAGTKAKTEAAINLGCQSFSIDMWLNYTADGRLLAHGVTGNGMAADIVDGLLCLTFGTTTLKSDSPLPRDKWIYLHISYDNDGAQPSVSASYAQDDQTVRLINGAQAPAYDAGGPLSLGGTTLTGKIHELALWNASRTMDEAQAGMYTAKSMFTDGLTGYWQFDEGHGTVAADKARSRHFVLPAASSWWTSAENYAALLDGTTALKANVAAATTTTADSYTLEAWFRADSLQNGDASILSLGDSLLSVGIDHGGQLSLTAFGNDYGIATADLRDNSWHHVALNVLKSTKGSATLYLDGNPVRQLSASAVPAFQGDALIVGAHRSTASGIALLDKFLRGAVDEVRLWTGTRTAEVVREMMYSRVSPESEGLAAYYPMEATSLDDNNQAVTTGSAADATGSSPTDLEAVSGSAGASAPISFTSASAPPLAARKTLENVAFSFVASERTVRISLDELPSRLEGSTVYITAKNIRDVHGNSMQQATWSVYVNQSTLRWAESAVSIGKDAQSTAVRDVTISNDGGQSEQYVVTGVPSWLSVDRPEGVIEPLASQQLRFTVDPGLAIGTHSAILWLIGNQNIELPLHLTVRVEGGRPAWAAADGENTMNVIGELSVGGTISTDTADMVAAFIDGRCVGVASPEYYSRYDAYIVVLNVYGDNADNRRPLTYKAYDASTGRTYPVVGVSLDAAATFVADTWAGSFRNPLLFVPEDKIEQAIGRDKAGWTWMSLYVRPADSSPQGVFGTSAGSIALVGSSTQSAKYDGGQWIGNLTAMGNTSMYKVNASEAFSETVIGKAVSPDTVAVALNAGWTWIGYPSGEVVALDAALADADPQEGDIVKSQSQFAIYSDGCWDGGLTAMVPGKGYCYYSGATQPKTFHYPVAAVASAVYAPQASAPAHPSATAPTAEPGYENNMTLTAVVRDGGVTVPNSTIEALGDSVGGMSVADARGLHFLTVGGNGTGALVTFRVTTPTTTYVVSQRLPFEPDAHYGSPQSPYVVQLADAAGIASTGGSGLQYDGTRLCKSLRIYTITGELLLSRDDCTPAVADIETMPSIKPGVYIRCIEYADGTVETVKITKEK